MSEVKKMGFGYQDDTDESLKGKSLDGVFGLNQNVHLVHFAYNPNAGKDDSEADAIDITIKVGESEQRRRIYDITKVYDGDNNEITDVNSDAYAEAYNKEWMQNSAMITHILKRFVDEATIKQALAQEQSSFKDYAVIVTSLLPANFQNIALDTFLEYQWNIPEGKDQTYLQLPKNMKGGGWLCKAQPGNFEPKTAEDGSLIYVNEQGIEHPFTRTKSFMESKKAYQQTVNDALNAAQAGAGAGGGQAKSGTW